MLGSSGDLVYHAGVVAKGAAVSPPVWHLDSRSKTHWVLSLSGDWSPATVSSALSEALVLGVRVRSRPEKLVFSGRNLGHWDALLAALLNEIGQTWRAAGGTVELVDLPEGLRALLDLALAVSPPSRPAPSPPRGGLGELGRNALALGADLVFLNRFVGEILLGLTRLLSGRARYRPLDLLLQIQDCGPSAVPIVSLISLLVGLILAFVGAAQLALFGAELYIADLVALGMVREMGPLMTAILMAGRSGAAFAAQIGTMQVNMEIPALKVMGLSPLDFLVLPRLLALSLVMPFLGLYADLLGITGGALVALTFFDIPLSQFLNRTAAAVDLYDVSIGLFKGGLFGTLVALAGCMRGLLCGRTASAVGDASTSAVVTAIVMIVVADSVVTLVCNRLNI